MEHIDTVIATSLLAGDLVELWDDEAEVYVIDEALSVEDDEDHVIVTTDRFPDGMAIPYGDMVRIFQY